MKPNRLMVSMILILRSHLFLVIQLPRQAIAISDSAQFAKILAKEEFRIELARLFPTTKGPRTADEVRFQMLRLHPDRCVFDVSMKCDDGWQSVIAKVFVDDRPDTFSSLDRVHQSGFGP